VPSLLALAAGVGAAQCLTAFDARMGEAYVAAYHRQGDAWQEIVSPALLASTQPVPGVTGVGWQLCGSGFDAFAWLREAYAPQASGHTPGLRPHARGVAQVAVEWLKQGRGAVAADEAAPLYLRDKVALTVAERRGAAA
jgi:tRNA threonylcarbamoyladenosine biosynthesis protein TsaB